MNYTFLNKFSKSQLEEFRDILCNDDVARSDLIAYVNKKIDSKEDEVNKITYSSERIPYYKEENQEKCLAFFRTLNVADFKFLYESFNIAGANVKNNFSVLKMLDIDFSSSICLSSLEEFYKNPKNIHYYEGTYNTINYIKNYIYYCLDKKNSLDIFEDYDKKFKLVADRLPSIAQYLYDIKSGTKLQLSITHKGFFGTISKKSIDLTYNQKIIADAVAFGSDLEKLENNDYSDAKRLLFLPRYIKDEK